MNRLVNYNQGSSIVSTRFDRHLFTLQWKAARQLLLKKQQLDSGQALISIPFTNFDGLVFPVIYPSEWVLDLAATNINESGFIGGVFDGLGLVPEKIYHIWAFADEQAQPKGFGLAQEPTTTFQTVGAAKGAEITITNMTKAYRFTLGSRIRVEHNNVTTAVNDTDWNLATVTELSSATQIKAVLDNNNVFGATYGAAIPVQAGTGGLITQLDLFRPYASDDANQGTLYPYYRLIGLLKTDGTAAPNTLIDGFEEIAQHSPPLGSIQAWHKTLAGTSPLLTDEWKECNGIVCKVDKSPLIGKILPDLNGQGRFLRGSATSGTLQGSNTFAHTHGLKHVKNTVFGTDYQYVAAGNSVSTGFSSIDATTLSSGGSETRPINMFVVYIIKVI